MSPETEGESVDTTGSTRPPRPALRLERVETWEARGQRWLDGGPVVDWARSEDPVYEIALFPLPDSQIAIALTVAMRDEHPRAVKVQLAARYYLADLVDGDEPPPGGNVDDTAEYVDKLDATMLMFLVNRGLDDVSPFIQEVVYNLSGRFFPEHPLVLNSRPQIDIDDIREVLRPGRGLG